MKRLLLLSTLTLLLVLIIGSSAFGTYARIRSLGNADYYFKDISHIYLNPAFLGQYTNTVYAELGSYYDWMDDGYTPYDQTLGINYKIYKGLSLGLTLNRYVEWNADVFPRFWYLDEDIAYPSPVNGYDLMASYDFEKLHLGVGFYHAGNKETAHEDTLNVDVTDDTASSDNYVWNRGSSDSWDGEVTSGITSLTGGFLFEVDENKWIEGMVSLSFDRAKSNYNQIDTSYYDLTYYNPGRDSNYYDYHRTTKETWEDNYKTKGGNRIELGARAFWEVAENFQIVPLFAFRSESISLDSMLSYDYIYHRTTDYSPPYYDDTTIYYDTTYATITSGKTGDYKESYFLIGLGGNLKLDKGMVAGGLNLTRYKTTDETDTLGTSESTSWYMPGFNLGVEYELTKWLTARVGMEKWFGRYESKYESKYDYDRWEPPYHYTGYDRGNGNYKDRYSNNPENFIGLGVGFKFSKFKVDATFGENTLFEGGYILSGKEKNMFGILSATFEF